MLPLMAWVWAMAQTLKAIARKQRSARLADM
jgi:hypothetical protein